MGELSKTITIQVPVDVVYNSIKSSFQSDMPEKYFSDFKLVKTSHRLKPAIAKDIPNSQLDFEARTWTAKSRVSYLFRPVEQSSCEVTIRCEYSGGLKALSVEQEMIADFERLAMLEKGYKAGRTSLGLS